MNHNGVDVALMMLTAPGVQMFAPVSDDDRAALYHLNAERVFGIPPPT